jgi:APA family basic amino acid/polyamine antiporter
MAEGLRREIGLFGAVAYGVGTILGAGVYALIGIATGKAGNAVWLAFVIAAGIAAFSGLSYAKLSSVFPHAGAEYVYVDEAFGSSFWAFLVGWLVLASSIISASAVALGFGGYISSIIGWPIEVWASILIIALSIVNFVGIRESLALNVIMTITELIGILLIIVLGIGFLGKADLTSSPNGLSGVIGAVGIIFFAFIGFEGLVKIGEETREPRTTIPRALLLSLAITAVIYVLVAISVVNILPYQELAASSSPLADVAMRANGPVAAGVLAFVALVSTANTVLIILIATSRIMYGMSSRSALPGILSMVHPIRGTPGVAILLTGLVSVAFCFLGGIELTANAANFTIFLVFLAVNLTVLQFARKGWRIGRVYIVSAVLGVITAILMLTQFGWEVMLLSAVIIIAGMGAYKLVERSLR